jgi:hypothetical protein
MASAIWCLNAVRALYFLCFSNSQINTASLNVKNYSLLPGRSQLLLTSHGSDPDGICDFLLATSTTDLCVNKLGSKRSGCTIHEYIKRLHTGQSYGLDKACCAHQEQAGMYLSGKWLELWKVEEKEQQD